MKSINRMYLISAILLIAGVCGLHFEIGWFLSGGSLALGIIMFLAAIAIEVPEKEKRANPHYWNRKSPIEEF